MLRGAKLWKIRARRPRKLQLRGVKLGKIRPHPRMSSKQRCQAATLYPQQQHVPLAKSNESGMLWSSLSRGVARFVCGGTISTFRYLKRLRIMLRGKIRAHPCISSKYRCQAEYCCIYDTSKCRRQHQRSLVCFGRRRRWW